MKKKLLLFSIGIALSFGMAVAQPANDACSGAIEITVGGGCVAGDNTGATKTGETGPSCFSPGNPNNHSHSVWYYFTATYDSISVNFGDGTLGAQTMGAMYSGTCGSLTEVGCAKDGAQINVTGLTVGATYYVMVDAGSTNVGTFCISAFKMPPPPPPRGTCLNPRNLFTANDCNNVSGNQYDEQNNIISTNLNTGGDGGGSMSGTDYYNDLETSCSGTDVGQQGYWVEFTATASTQTFTNEGGTGYDYQLYTGECGSLSPVSCTTINSGSSSNITGLSAGTKYKVLITPSGTGTATTAFLCITGTSYTNPYDNCSNALSISANTSYTLNNSNTSADRSLCSGSMENNMWVYWTAPADWTGFAYVHLYNQDCACENGLQMSIYTASSSCPPNASPTCEITINPNNSNDFYGQFTPTPGSTYYITIDGYAGCSCEYNLAITGTSLVPVLATKLNKFHGKAEKGYNSIEWTVSKNKNYAYFVLERSEDGNNFENIATVYAREKSNYEYKDTEAGVYYYRLKMFDKEENYMYSNLIKIENVFEQYIKIYPTNVGSERRLFVSSKLEEPFEIIIVNTLGQPVVQEMVAARSITNIDVNHLSKGLHIVQTKTSTGKVENHKIIIN